MTFKNLKLPKEILSAIDNLGYENPTPIQSTAIPIIVAGSDLKASANTGSGKTAAFLIPALKRVMSPFKEGKGPRVIILVPTRELAMQVSQEATKLGKFLPTIKTVCIYGGVPYPKQKKQLSKKIDILIATPGRFIDHLRSKRLDLSFVEMFVLDEADRMLDMGFFDSVQEIYKAFFSHPQTLMFSATLEGSVLKFSKKLLRSPETISLKNEKNRHEDIDHNIHFADNLSHKKRLLNHLLSDEVIEQAIVFTSTKRFADELVDSLKEDGHRSISLHGDMCQRQRTRIIKRMREGKTKILVATDIAARGLDICTISHVFNFDLPTNPEDYVHRIGRTGRAGSKGQATSLVSHQDRRFLRQIEKFIGQKISVLTIPGLEPKTKQFTTPIGKKAKTVRRRTRPSFRKNFTQKTSRNQARKKKIFDS